MTYSTTPNKPEIAQHPLPVWLKNTTPTPNAMYDDIMPLLSGDEWKVVSSAVRLILGQKNHRESRQANISLTTWQDRTGLSRPTLVSILENLHQLGILKKIGAPARTGQRYYLPLPEDLPLAALRQRRATAKTSRRENIKPARAKRPVKAVDQSQQSTVLTSSGQGDLPAAVKAVDQYRSTVLTTSGQPDLPPAVKAVDTLKEEKAIKSNEIINDDNPFGEITPEQLERRERKQIVDYLRVVMNPLLPEANVKLETYEAQYGRPLVLEVFANLAEIGTKVYAWRYIETCLSRAAEKIKADKPTPKPGFTLDDFIRDATAAMAVQHG